MSNGSFNGISFQSWSQANNKAWECFLHLLSKPGLEPDAAAEKAYDALLAFVNQQDAHHNH
jgi:hypothetical protein